MIKNNGSSKIKLTKRKKIIQPVEVELSESLVADSSKGPDKKEQAQVKLDKKKPEISLNKNVPKKPQKEPLESKLTKNIDNKDNSSFTVEAFFIFVMIVFFIFHALDVVPYADKNTKLGTVSSCSGWKPLLKNIPEGEKFEQSKICGDVTDGILMNKITSTRNAIGKGEKKKAPKEIAKVKLSSKSYHICSPWLPKPKTISKGLSFTQNQVCGDMDRGKLFNQKRTFRGSHGAMLEKAVETITYGPWSGKSPNNHDVNTTVVQTREKFTYLNGKISLKTTEKRSLKGTNPVIKKYIKKPTKKIVNNKYRDMSAEFMLISALRVNLLKIKESKGLNNYKFVHPGFINLVPGLSDFAKSSSSYSLEALHDSYTVTFKSKRNRDCDKFIASAYKLEGIHSVVVNTRENIILAKKKYYTCRDGRNDVIAVFK